MISRLKAEFSALLDLISPRRCLVCRQTLAESERHICVKCYLDLPRTGYHKAQHSFLETNYWAKIPIHRAAAYFFYTEQNREILFGFKYHQKPQIGQYLGQLMAEEIVSQSDFFSGIDIIVPIPLHPGRQRQRGYNQSHYIAKGISQVTHIPICEKAVVRTIDNESQTHLLHTQRKDNVEGIFRCLHPELLRGKHILLVDDVITTGATTASCAQAVLQALGEYNEQGLNTTASVQFSILALATATSHRQPMEAGDGYTYEATYTA